MKKTSASKLVSYCVLILSILSCELADTTDEKEKEETVYTIVYDGNGSTSGTVPLDSGSYAEGAAVTVKANTGGLAKTGYEWKGWNTVSDGSGTTYAAGATFAMGNANLRLYAKWELPSGTALWAKSVLSGLSGSFFSALAAAQADAVYTVGYQYGTGEYSYGTGVSVMGKNGYNNAVIVKYDASGSAQWAKAATTAPDQSLFVASVAPSAGAVYAAGYQYAGTFYYGSGVFTIGGYASGQNALLVKYDSSGTAQWAKTATTASNNSLFFGIAADASGNVYAAGEIEGTGSFDFGSGAVNGPVANNNAVLVKYDDSGNALWTKPVTGGSSYSQFKAVALDSSGNVYAVGVQGGTNEFTYAAGVTATGGSSGDNGVIVKYDSSGNAQWAKAVTSGTAGSVFAAVAADSSGGIYVSGYLMGTSSYDFGNGKTASGLNGGNNAFVAKFDSNGNAQWVKTATTAPGISAFSGIAADSSGNIYAAGYQYAESEFVYGPGVAATGTYSAHNQVLVKYDSSGTALFAKVVAGSDSSDFSSVAADSSGSVYAAGNIDGIASYDYSNGATAVGKYDGSSNAVIVKYAQ